MGIEIKKVTSGDRLLKIISVLDDAIDWEKSFPDERDSSIEEKQRVYERDHDLSQLVFLEDKKPTMFVFKHPLRVDVSRKIRNVYTLNLSRGSARSDMFTDIFHVSYLGTEEGIDGGILAEAPRRDSLITDAYMQGLEDSGVFEEIAQTVVAIINKKPTNNLNKKK